MIYAIRSADATFPCPRAFIDGRGVVLAMRSRKLREARWWWLMEHIGW